MKSKLVVSFILMILLSFIFQLIPVYLNKPIDYITLLSPLPIALLCDKPSKAFFGAILTYLLISIFSVESAITFVMINAVMGLNLGICKYYSRNNVYTSISGGILFILGIILCIRTFSLAPFGINSLPLLSVDTLILLLSSIVIVYVLNLLFKYISSKVSVYIQ